MGREDDNRKEERWLIVDTGFGRFLGKVLDGTVKGQRGGTLTDRAELVLGNAIRIEMVNVPTRQGIAVQAVPSSPVPWLPLFSRESVICLPLDRVVWYADVDEDVVTEMRSSLLSAGGGGGPHTVGA